MKLPKPNLNKILLYYSVLLSTIMMVGGFYTARSSKTIISNLLFLPVAVFLWIVLIRKIKEGRKIKIEKEEQTPAIQTSPFLKRE